MTELKDIRKNITEEMTPTELFEQLKMNAGKAESLELKKYYSVSSKLLEKAIKLGQKRQVSRLTFILKSLEREAKIRELGFTQFIYANDLSEYIKKVTGRHVKIVDVEDYPREIPDEIAELILTVKENFDNLIIVYTDYTDEIGQQVEKDKRDKDPILFGAFFDENTGTLTERLYFLGDWEDEYCDLTLDKLIEEYKEISEDEIVYYSEERNAETILNNAENYLEDLTRKSSKYVKTEKRKSIFTKVRSLLKGK